MAIVYRSTSGVINNSSNSFVVASITGLVAGDLLIGTVASASGVTWTPPAGWTAVLNTTDYWAGYKIATSGDVGATFTFTPSGVANATVGVSAYGGGVYDVSATAQATLTSPGATTTKPSETVVRVLTQFLGVNAGGSTITVPSGTTQRYVTGASGNPGGHIGVADSTLATAGATGTAAWTNSLNFTSSTLVLTISLSLPGIGSSSGRRGYAQTIKGWRGRGVLTF